MPADLFAPDPAANLLPCDGIVNYHGPIMKAAEADRCFSRLLDDVPWRQDELVMFGRRITTARKVAWYGDSGFAYTYSGTTKEALPWTDELLRLKSLVEEISGGSFNSCLLNLYHTGGEGMAWHSDDESTLVPQAAIASVSLGAERPFAFKHKSRPELRVSIKLQHGSLLVMKGATQEQWLHSLPKSARVDRPRINLTFRSMLPQVKS